MSLVSTCLTLGCKVTLKRMPFKSLKHLLEEVIVLVSLRRFLADDKSHAESSDGIRVYPAVRAIFPQVILFKKQTVS